MSMIRYIGIIVPSMVEPIMRFVFQKTPPGVKCFSKALLLYFLGGFKLSLNFQIRSENCQTGKMRVCLFKFSAHQYQDNYGFFDRRSEHSQQNAQPPAANKQATSSEIAFIGTINIYYILCDGVTMKLGGGKKIRKRSKLKS